MEFSNEHFLKLKEKKRIAMKNAQYFYALSSEYRERNKNLGSNLFRRAERIMNCLNYWEWNMYKKNKLLSLNKVSRCKDIFCPNCRSINVYKAIINFSTAFKRMLAYEYNPYLKTLTVPNIERKELAREIDKMNKAFVKFWRWLYKQFSKNGEYYGGYKDRLFDAKGAVKVLEVTLQRSDWNYFNLHFHVIVFLENDFIGDFIKEIDGGYQYKTKRYIFFYEASDDWQDNYICDIRELSMPKGIYEVFKYCFKDLDIRNQEIFKDLYFGLKRRRLRQGYGELYNVKVDDMDIRDKDCIENYLEFKDEEPEVVANRYISDMTEKYKDYRKVSLRKS